MTILISDEEGNEIVSKRGYEDESEMQEYIESNPEAIPLHQIDEGTKIEVASREFNVSSGRLDAIAFDSVGNIYVIESKLKTNSDRRKIIAQAFDYGVSLWENYDPQRLVDEVQKDLNDKKSFQSWVEEELLGKERSYDTFEANMFSNLREGSFRYVIIMDEIKDHLESTIQYLNTNSNFDVYGVELECYSHEEKNIVVPQLHGNQVKKNPAATSDKGPPRKPWNEENFYKELESNLSDEEFQGIKEFYRFCKEKSDNIVFGERSKRGSVLGFFPGFKENHATVAFYGNGKIRFYFWFDEKTNQVLRNELSKVDNLGIKEDDEREKVEVSIENCYMVIDDLKSAYESILARKS